MSPIQSMPEGFIGASGFRPFGDGAGDEGLALLGQPVQQRTLLLDQPVDPRGLLIQKPRNPPLRGERVAISKGALGCLPDFTRW